MKMTCICEACSTAHDGTYGSGRFCSVKCSRGFATMNKRKEINQKVSEALKQDKKFDSKVCPTCQETFNVEWRRRNYRTFCSRKCQANYPPTKALMSARQKTKCEDVNERIRLRDIGRKGGFGTKGHTVNGTEYASKFEKVCFEYLENAGIIFEAHKPLPASSKVSDVYIPSTDTWIELDGIDREKNKVWLGKLYDMWVVKLKLYKELNLKLYVVKTFKEFEQLFA